MVHPSSGNDWIELYNTTSNNLDINGWSFVDSTSKIKDLNGIIEAGGFLVFEVTNRLNNGRDEIFLKDTSDTIIDNYSYSSDPGIDNSIGRIPDGNNWTNGISPTKGLSNGNTEPNASPTQTPTSAPSSTPTPTPVSSASSSDFSISGVPSQINSDQSFSVSINLSIPSKPDTEYFLTGAFKSVEGSRYFGLTKTDSGWVEYSTSSSNRYKLTTNNSGSWQGDLEVKPDPNDSNYKGSGDYIFKVGRYTSTGSTPTWSNEVTIKITGDKSEDNEQSQSETDERNEEADTSSTSTNSFNNASVVRSRSQGSSSDIDYQIATVAGVSETAPQMVESFSKNNINWILWSGFGFIILGGGIFSYTYFFKYRRIKKISL